MAGIPHVCEISFDYGLPDQVSPRIRRIIANNPGPFTYTGTGVYIIGQGEVAVIDPGPPLEDHFAALKSALQGETVTHVLVTHTHMDHSPLAQPLARWAGCKVYGRRPADTGKSEIVMEAGTDLDFIPDETIADGWRAEGPGWTLEAIETPGHMSNHVCYALLEEQALFSGDHIMGWSTTVISPPDGDMGAYLESLAKIRDRDFATLWPTHGPPVTEDVSGFITACIDHRRAREEAILDELTKGEKTIIDMVKTIYTDIDERLYPAASHSVLAHLIHLVRYGRVSCNETAPGLHSIYRLSPPA